MRRLPDGRPKLKLNNVFFKIFAEKDFVSIEEAVARCNRKEHGKKFVQNRLTTWKRDGLAEPYYGRYKEDMFGRKLLLGLHLTPRGARYFNRKTLTVEELLRIVSDFKKGHPEIAVTLELHACDPDRSPQAG